MKTILITDPCYTSDEKPPILKSGKLRRDGILVKLKVTEGFLNS